MANNSYAPAAGYLGRVQVSTATTCANPTTICANSWTFDETVDPLDVMSFCSGGYKEYLAGPKDGTFTFTGIWDFNFNPFVGAPAMKIGTNVCVKFFIDWSGHATLYASTAQGLVTDWNVTEGVGSTCTYTCTIKANWTFNDFANTAA